MDNKKQTQDAFLQAMDIMIDQKLKNLKFNYYVDGVVQQAYSDDTYKVLINNTAYDRVPSLHRMDFQAKDAVQILVKNGDWNKKYIVEKTKADNAHNLYNIGERPMLPESANLNDYLTVGCWGVYGNAIAKTLLNCPSDIAGNFTVECALGQTKEDSYVYLMQRYETVDGFKYFRYCRRHGYDAEWIFGDWMLVLDTQQAKDYVIEEGTSGIWSYRKWKSGVAECWSAYSFKPSNTGVISQKLAYPFRFATNVPVVVLTKAQNATIYGEVFNSDASGNRPDIMNVCDITFDGCQSTQYDIGVNIQVIGRWK
jgi:hypothetical protein